MTELAAPPPGNEALRAWTRALARTTPIGRGEGMPLPLLLPHLAERFADRPALLSDATVLDYRGLAAQAARYAQWAAAQGVGAGDVVCLLLPNAPDYVAIWLGITAVGGVAALLNTNLTGAALAHAIAAVAPRHVIVGTGFAATFAAVRAGLPAGLGVWTHGGDAETAIGPRIEAAVANLAPSLPAGRAPALSDTALCIYTSGTTGLPKAARVSHRRVAEWSAWFAGLIDTQPDDRMYNCLPMYHSVGGVVAVGAMLAGGGSVLVRERFSVRRFWDDVAEHGCTVFQYIGELCRYLVAAPPHARERAHRLRLACGNGLRGEVWEAFQARFAIPRILEFYASTEGNVSLYNCTGRPGAIGHIPAFLAHRFPIALVRCDPETGAAVRDAAGLCIPCGPGEAGEALGRIGSDGDGHGRPFEGYTDAAASERKVLRDVLAKGDAWFRTGDLMRRDAAGFYYFVDRIGDTFRWKGENVATEEVAQILRACPGVADVAVYGVAVPGHEGRAGMAAVTPDAGFDLAALRRQAATGLPDYARPLFLRLCARIEVTGTFKPMKAALARDGYDPARVPDPLYFDDRAAGAYVLLDAALHGRLCDGSLRL